MALTINKRPKDDVSDDEKEVDDLTKWLKKFGLTKYEGKLRQEELEYEMIELLDDEIIKDLCDATKMNKLHKKVFVKAINQVKSGQYPPKEVVKEEKKQQSR